MFTTLPDSIDFDSITPGNAKIDIDFDSSPGPITAYSVRVNGGAPITVSSVYESSASGNGYSVFVYNSGIRVKNLINGNAYSIAIAAVNAAGIGAYTTTGPVTPTGTSAVPDAPTDVTATAGNGAAVVDFSVPLNNGSAITSYTVTSDPGGFTGTGSSSPIAVNGLVNGTSYTFSVIATNGVGDSGSSDPSNPVTPVANTFWGVEDTYWNNVVFASRFEGSNGGDAFDEALNFINAGDGALATGQKKSGGSSFYIPGTGAGPYIQNSQLNFGSNDFTVEMWVYPQTMSNDSRVPYAGENPPPDNVAANNFLWAFELSHDGLGWWDAAGSRHSSNVNLSLNTWQHVAAARRAGTTTLYLDGVAVTSFADSVDYTRSNPAMWLGATVINGEYDRFVGFIDDLRVTGGVARYSGSFTPSSQFSGGSTPPTPGAPTRINVNVGDRWALVSFQPPAFTGGSINSYTVTATPTSGGAPVVVSGNSSPIFVPNLDNQLTYTFTVSATNGSGVGSAATASGTWVPRQKPMLLTSGTGGGQNNYFSLALAADGKVYTWGDNSWGTLGRSITSATPAAVPAISYLSLNTNITVRAIGAGTYHVLAAGNDGYIYGWGSNDHNQLGFSPNVFLTPTRFRLANSDPSIVPLAVTGGRGHSLALGSDGQVYAWGLNVSGQIGDGSQIDWPEPKVAQLPVSAVAIAAGSYSSFAIGSDGLVYAWGDNSKGQLGQGTTVDSKTPLPVVLKPADTSVKAVSIAVHGDVVKVLGSDGLLYAWGTNSSGQVGNGNTNSPVTQPVAITLPATTAVQFASGFNHSVALGNNGTLYTWGDNSNGQLGNGGNPAQALTPTAITLPDGATPLMVAAGAYQNLVYANNGQIYAWGNNSAGQLGDGTLTQRSSPVAIGYSLSLSVITVPTAPRSLSVNTGDGSAHFHFQAPLSNGGAAISGYSVSCSAVNGSNDGVVHSASGNSLSLHLSDLHNNVDYTCLVTASNSAGTGSPASITVRPFVEVDNSGPTDTTPTPPSKPEPSTTPAGTTTPVTNPSSVLDNADSIGATVDSSGSVVLPSGGVVSVSLSDKTPENVGIKPAAGTTYTITNSNGSSVKITGLTPDTLLVTRKVGNTTLIEVASGTARIEPTAGTAIPLASKSDQSVGTLSAASGSTTPTAVIVRRDSKGIDAFIETGTTVYKNVSSNGKAVPDTTVYGGETANFSNQGNINQVKLGSLDGDRNLPGDPLKNIPNIDPGLVIPQIDGKVNRLGGQSLVDSFKNQLDAALGNPPGTEVSFDPATGVVVYRLNGVEARFIPLGNLLVSLTGFADNGFVSSNPAQAAAGTFTLIDRGVQLTLASTLGYFNDFNAAVKAADPVGKVTLKASGAIWLDMQGAQYITQPGYLAASSDVVGKPSVIFNDAGQLSFRDSHGGVQTLFPTLADGATLQNVFVKFDPAAVVKLQGDGTAAATLAGHDFVLVPQYYLKPIPIQYTGQPWWVDQGAIYYAMPTLGKGQGFTIK